MKAARGSGLGGLGKMNRNTDRLTLTIAGLVLLGGWLTTHEFVFFALACILIFTGKLAKRSPLELVARILIVLPALTYLIYRLLRR